MIENSAIIVNKIVSVREITYIVPLAFTTLFISNKPYVYIRILNPTNKYKILLVDYKNKVLKKVTNAEALSILLPKFVERIN